MTRFEIREVPPAEVIGDRKYRIWDNEIDRFADRPALAYSWPYAEEWIRSLKRIEAAKQKIEVQND